MSAHLLLHFFVLKLLLGFGLGLMLRLERRVRIRVGVLAKFLRNVTAASSLFDLKQDKRDYCKSMFCRAQTRSIQV